MLAARDEAFGIEDVSRFRHQFAGEGNASGDRRQLGPFGVGAVCDDRHGRQRRLGLFGLTRAIGVDPPAAQQRAQAQPGGILATHAGREFDRCVGRAAGRQLGGQRAAGPLQVGRTAIADAQQQDAQHRAAFLDEALDAAARLTGEARGGGAGDQRGRCGERQAVDRPLRHGKDQRVDLGARGAELDVHLGAFSLECRVVLVSAR